MAKQLSAQLLIFMISLQQISPTIGTKSSTVASLPLPVVGIQNISPENQPASIPICPSAPHPELNTCPLLVNARV